MNNSGKPFRRFLLLWSGQFISAIGSRLTSFGLILYNLKSVKKLEDRGDLCITG